jgi:hypothetical protein
MFTFEGYITLWDGFGEYGFNYPAQSTSIPIGTLLSLRYLFPSFSLPRKNINIAR